MSGRSSGSTDARWTFQRPLQRLDRRVRDAPAAAPAAPPEMEAAAPGEGLRDADYERTMRLMPLQVRGSPKRH